ncbi:MAG: alpha/beta hydrolase [Mangrovibacterium sp.]|nr:alpha/beta hydrolase [Mangrovibacterium sp.]
MKSNIFVLFFLLRVLFSNAYAQPLILDLWQEEIPNSLYDPEYIESTDTQTGSVRKVTIPQLLVYLPSEKQATGTAVLICPGGGYETLAINHEGHDIAKWLNEQGIAGVILKYRLPSDKIMRDKTIGPLQDAQEAIRTIRRNAEKWNINPRKIGVIGFSAGGHLASTLSVHYGDKLYDLKEDVSARPDYTILVYPVVSFDSAIANKWCKIALLGDSPTEDQLNYFSSELQATSDTPPAFLVHSANDPDVCVANSIRYFESLQKKHVSSELHIYEKGGHGYWLAIGGGTESGWPQACLSWIKCQQQKCCQQ